MPGETTSSIDRKPSLLDQLSIVQIILTLCLALGGGAVSVLLVQGNTTTRLSAVETQNEKQDRAVEDLRSQMLTKDDLGAVVREMTALREDLKEIRQELLRQARGERR